MKQTTEIIEIVKSVRITYGNPEARDAAVKMAANELHLDMWSSESGGISAKSQKNGYELRRDA